jgi:chromosome segregation and condensation protein ScpB
LLDIIDHLNETFVKDLQDPPDNIGENKPTQRLLAAIAYKNCVTQTELAGWHDTGRRTVSSWLMRLDTDEPLEQAVSVAHRS